MVTAEEKLREALAVVDVLLKQEPKERNVLILHANVLRDLSRALTDQDKYAQAQELLEQALQGHRAVQDTRNEATTLGELGTLAAMQRDYAQASSRFLQAIEEVAAQGLVTRSMRR